MTDITIRLSMIPLIFFAVLITMEFTSLVADQNDSEILTSYRTAAMGTGDAGRGKRIFESKAAACTKCHTVGDVEQLAGPGLDVIGDKYTREQLIRSVLEPSASIHPDYAAIVVVTRDGQTHTGVLRRRSDTEIELYGSDGKIIHVPLHDVDEQQRSKTSLMPGDLFKSIKPDEFADLITFLTTLRQAVLVRPGLPAEISEVTKPLRLEPFHSEEMRFDHPVWMIAKPGTRNTFLVVEQQTCKIWMLQKGAQKDTKTLFADISHESATGQFEGVMCLAFHPDFVQNRRYYLNYHVREEGIFSPVIVERRVTADLSRDAGGASRRLLRIKQPTDMHWGGMLAFGPDGYLYIGAGDAGPQEDPDGHGQDLSLLLGKILRIDVDHTSGEQLYSVPETNPFKGNSENVRPEIWAYGFRMPWRFSWDSKTRDLWVGDVGQNLFEEVSIARVGENHGWNVYEGFTPFSSRYRRAGEAYIAPVVAYRRRYGVSVTGGYVYRGKRSPSFVGAYIFSDFESKRVWALRQSGRQLEKIRQIGNCPEKPASFSIDKDGELFIVGYEGTIFRLILDDAVFE